MRRFRLFTFIKEGFKGVFRNGLMSVASILVLFSSLFMIGIFTTLVKNVNYNLDAIEDFNDLVCYMSLDATDEQIAEAKKTIVSCLLTENAFPRLCSTLLLLPTVMM